MNQYVDQSIALWVIFMSVIAFLLYGVDKYKAVHHRWRIPEQTLILAVVHRAHCWGCARSIIKRGSGSFGSWCRSPRSRGWRSSATASSCGSAVDATSRWHNTMKNHHAVALWMRRADGVT